MKNVTIRTLIAIMAITTYSCSSDDIDLDPPSMDVVSYTPTPTTDEICGSMEPVVFNLVGGEVLGFEAIFNDDVALSQYKIDIHNNFDCHGHGGGSAPSIAVPNVQNQTTDWSVLEIVELSGTTAPVDKSLQVPVNITAGNYHYHIQVIDESGNDSPLTNFFALKIKNPTDDVTPSITVTEPSTKNINIARGESIRFIGQVTDDYSLSEGGNGILYLSYTDLSSGNTFATDQAFIFDDSVDTVYDFDFEYTIPQTLVSGSYRLSLGANDGVRNVADFIFFDVEVQ